LLIGRFGDVIRDELGWVVPAFAMIRQTLLDWGYLREGN
jgi:hypothetical protein